MKGISIVIATFNSERHLDKVLSSIQKQSIDRSKIEIIIVDGGSSDTTIAISRKYGAVLVDNPLVDPVNAKYLGYKASKFEIVAFLDHDEVLIYPNCLEIVVDIFSKNQSIAGVIGAGYHCPTGYSFLNQYINDFGDPFSAFYYNLSKDYRFFVKTMKARYTVKREDEISVELSFKLEEELPLLELCAAGGCIRRAYFDKMQWTSMDIPHLFKKIVEGAAVLSIAKDYQIMHFSTETLNAYKNKIKWRIKNNIFFVDTLGMAGFTGRVVHSGFLGKVKKLLYLPFCFLLIPVFVSSVRLCIQRRDMRYLLHLPLSVYTAFWIVAYSVAKIFGYSPLLKSYDGKSFIRDGRSE